MDAPQHVCVGCRRPLTWRARVPEDHYATLGLRELRRDQYLCRECYTQLHYPWARQVPLRALRGALAHPQFCVPIPRLLRTPHAVSASRVCALTACSDWWTTVCSSNFRTPPARDFCKDFEWLCRRSSGKRIVNVAYFKKIYGILGLRGSSNAFHVR